jgi:hypothetical protein
MPEIIPNRYPLDYTGTSASNLIKNEQVTLAPGQVRAFTPLYSPFFKKNISIIDATTGLELTTSQYSCKVICASASAIAGAGNEVYSIVIILDDAVSNSLVVGYQTVGGPYTTDYEAIMGLVNNLLTTNQVGNNDPVDWDVVEHLPEGFPENLHLHPLGQTTGWEFLAATLEKLRQAILLGDQLSKSFVLSYVDTAIGQVVNIRDNVAANGTPFGDHVHATNNPHNVTPAQVGLEHVQNFGVATLTEAYEGVRSDVYLTADLVQAVVQDRVDMGIDAHILDLNNPHAVTKTQVGLALIQNYDVASSGDLDTPVSGATKYVTNLSAAAWLNTYFTTLNSVNNTALATLTATAANAVTVAQAALDTASQALTTVQAAQATIATATQAANDAVTTANQNLVSVQNSNSAAITLLQEYVATAVVNAEAAGYSNGFTDGQAAP